MTGLYDAKWVHAPVLAITGQAAVSVWGAGYQPALNLDRIFVEVGNVVPEAVGAVDR